MKAGWRLFVGLSIFYAIVAVIYYLVGGEAVGITAIALSSGLAGMIGFYLWFTAKRLGNVLPEDNMVGEIADSATTCCSIYVRSGTWFIDRLVAHTYRRGRTSHFDFWIRP